jgi:hypothetical protein
MAPRFQELGVSSDSDPRWGLRQDEFITELRGTRGTKKFREMRENDPIVGAILMAMDMMIRAVDWRIEGEDQAGNDFLESVINSMDTATFEEFISDVLSFLPYGFSVFEIVWKRRPEDGRIGIAKLAPRAQWTIDRFDTTDTGEITGVWQMATQKSVFIPYEKVLHFRTVSINDDPAGRSVLRSAFTSWYYQNKIKEIEAIAIERELNGLPMATVPSEYLRADATPDQIAFVNSLKQILRDVRKNEQGYIIVPSDLYQDDDGRFTSTKMVEIKLLTSQGTRDIDTGKTILRYQQDMARSVMADFVMLGANDRGSFALSESKADLFLRALEGFVDSIAGTLNRVLVPRLWAMNGMTTPMPKITRGRIAPVQLDELGNFIQRLTLAGADLFPDDVLDRHVRDVAGLPPPDPNRPPRPAQVAPEAPPAEEPPA